MDDAAEIELRDGFMALACYREQLHHATDPQLRATLYTLIRETEEKLARLRLEVYRPVVRHQR